MGFIIGLLTFVMVLDCIALILLVLIQLPKKEAGLGLAFGGGAADTLFGAGAGTVLTKATKYAAGIFFGLALMLGLMQNHYFASSNRAKQLEMDLQKQGAGAGTIQLPPASTTPESPAPAGAVTPPATGATAVKLPAATPAPTNTAPPK